jgi:N-acyl-D-amino-acid deacylase
MTPRKNLWVLLAIVVTGWPVTAADRNFDVLLRNVRIFDGSGAPEYLGDVGVKGDKIVAVGRIANAGGAQEFEGGGRWAVAPGFINMLSGADAALLHDGRSLGDIRQGVTLEVMGEGESMGPLTPAMKDNMREGQGDLKFEVDWTTLGEFLDGLVHKGVACNVASFVGAATLRIHELGYADRAPSAAELRRMKVLARDAMREGALGVSSALIYAPGFYAKTDELIELAREAARHDGIYISHLRSEGNGLVEAVDEFLTIVERAGVRGEVYHFKAAGVANWPKIDDAIERLEGARRRGLKVTADMYPYTAAATGLDAAMPPWVQEGGYREWARRLKDPALRERVAREMRTRTDKWESLYLAAGSPTNVLLAGFKNESLKPYTGKTLAEVAALRGKSAEETAMDLVVEDGTRVSVIYFVMSEANVRKELALPWVSFCSDEGSYAPEGAFLKSNPHPRAYGAFARVLGRYVRDEHVIALPEAVRRLTSAPAEVLKLNRRGRLLPGYHADLVVFDPETVSDRATYAAPHQLATGVACVWVNGVKVLNDGAPTGAMPGMVVRGPGWRGRR